MPARTDNLPGGIALVRYYLTDPDELGTVAQWQAEIDGLVRQLPFPPVWERWRLEIWHMCHPDLQMNYPNLRDYDTATPGCQVAAGLYLGGKRLQLGVFPDRWSPEQTVSGPIRDSNRLAALRTLSHEVGHMVGDIVGLAQNRDDISREITRLFRILRPNQTANEHEDWAETYRACLGADAVRGTFSDNKTFIPAPGLLALMRAAYWLSVALRGKAVHSLIASGAYVQWAEPGWFWTVTYYRLNTACWQVERFSNGAWVRA